MKYKVIFKIIAVVLTIGLLIIYWLRQKCIFALGCDPYKVNGDVCVGLKLDGLSTLVIDSGMNQNRIYYIVYTYEMQSGDTGTINQILYPRFLKYEVYSDRSNVGYGL